MTSSKDQIEPLRKELPSHFADRLGISYAKTVSQEHKKSNGQFFTPRQIAELMGTFILNNAPEIRLLDPGCGTAILTCALLERLADRNKGLEKIELVVYETDSELIPYTTNSLDYLGSWMKSKNINFLYSIRTNDFILENAECLRENKDLFSSTIYPFDILVSNPPYYK